MTNFATGVGHPLAKRAEEYYAREGATDFVVVPPLAAAIAAGASVEGQPQEVKWKEPGFVIAIMGQELAGTAAKFAQTEIRIQVGGSRDVFSDGRVGQFMPLLCLFGGYMVERKFTRYVDPATSWWVTWRNRDAGATATPFGAFSFVSMRALGK